jgi:hypothetical protein
LPAETRTISRIFRAAAIYGVAVLLPLYFLAVPDPYFLTQLGFAGVAIAFQGVFWIIARDPVRYRAIIPFGVLEKVSFGIPAVIFAALDKAEQMMILFGAIDLIWAAAFVWAFVRIERKI